MTDHTIAEAMIQHILNPPDFEWPTTSDLRDVAEAHGIVTEGDWELTLAPNVIFETRVSEEFCSIIQEMRQIGKERVCPWPMTMLDVLVREETLVVLPMPDNDMPEDGYPDEEPHWQPVFWVPMEKWDELMSG